MTEYMHLVGAETVQSAANSMRHVADEMNRAAASMQQAVSDQQRVLDNFLCELRNIMESATQDSVLRTALSEIANGDPESHAGPLVDIARKAIG